MNANPNLTAIFKDPEKRWGWIKYQLGLQGKSLAEIARTIPTRPTYLHKLKTLQCPRHEIKLAQAVGVTPQVLFPERYDEHGVPKRVSRVPANGSKLTKRQPARNLQRPGRK